MSTIVGRIDEILECWPLELVVRTDQGPQRVTLADNCQVSRQGQPAAPGDLRVDDEVHCTRDPDGTGLVRAIRVV